MRSALLVVVSLVLVGCGGSDSSATEPAPTEPTSTELVPSAPADLELNETVELPADFPDEVPLPSDLELERAEVIAGDESNLIVVTGHIVDDDSVALGAVYEERLLAAGFAATQRSDAASSVFYTYDNGDWFVSAGFNADAVRKTGSTFGITVGRVGSAPPSG